MKGVYVSKIDKTKPLPDHTRINYYECCAKLILEEVFPERYSELKLDDAPDIQGCDVGIEVTIGNNQKKMEALNNWVKANACEDDKKRKKYTERMAQLGVKYTGGVQGWPLETPSFKETKNAVNGKIKKLQNGGYKEFPRYELFVFTDTWYHDTIIRTAKEHFFEESVCDWFKTIYVFSMETDLHIFETDIKEHTVINIETSEQSDRNRRARRMVEDAEDMCENE